MSASRRKGATKRSSKSKVQTQTQTQEQAPTQAQTLEANDLAKNEASSEPPRSTESTDLVEWPSSIRNEPFRPSEPLLSASFAESTAPPSGVFRSTPKLDRATTLRQADDRQARFVAGLAALAFAVGVVFFFAGEVSRRLDPPSTSGDATISTPQKLADAVAAEVEKERSGAKSRRAVVETSVKTAEAVSDANEPAAVNAAVAPAPSAETLTFVVELNSASKAELENLPRVGEKLAERIIERREELGGFRSVDDLLDVKGIGEKTLEKMRPHCVVAPLDDAE